MASRLIPLDAVTGPLGRRGKRTILPRPEAIAGTLDARREGLWLICGVGLGEGQRAGYGVQARSRERRLQMAQKVTIAPEDGLIGSPQMTPYGSRCPAMPRM